MVIPKPSRNLCRASQDLRKLLYSTNVQDGSSRHQQEHHRHPTPNPSGSVLSRDGPLHHPRRSSSSSLLKSQLRTLLRDTAQPVAVVTSLLPNHAGSSSRSLQQLGSPPVKGNQSDPSRFHGATLSSFTSISMDPHPLVAFALRIPSRMASTLSEFASELPSHPSSHSASKKPGPGSTNPSHIPSSAHHKPPKVSSISKPTSHMVINLLSHSQSSIAQKFSRPDLFPHPFEDTPYTLSKDGLPILHDSLAAISCRLVGPPLKLCDMGHAFDGELEEPVVEELEEGAGTEGGVGGRDIVSELFIARVLRVEQVPHSNGSPKAPSPLLYYQRGYTTC
ncbi:flavin reductase like domain-containing protein [Coprinopsis sp. MPI-PUGE-AT-0042]|nr:flavin reductase like domain-containing protein [Coprinopsis sp. MPI-PUGE-AT-0042]